ncbi:MAG TPA: hypothetical protein VKW78_19380 [Terriglobales bacterium]|nr:hypothetical protein [Terriglobales bacterium]
MPNAPLTVTPVLQTASGQTVKLAPVTIPANEVRSVDINAAVADPANGISAPFYGSIDIQYNAKFHGNLFAAEMLGIMGQPVMFHLDPTGLDPDYTSGSIDGFWWNRHTGVQDVLVLSNNASTADTAHLVLSDAVGHQWASDYTIAPHSIVRLNTLELTSAAKFTSDFGSIHIVAGHPGSFDVVYFMYDASKGFSALMKMFYYDAHTTKAEHAWIRDEGWMLWAPMLALQTPDPALLFPASVRLQPIIFLENLASKPGNLQMRVYWRSASGSGKTNSQTVTLKAGEVQKIDVASQFKDLPSNANWATVSILSNTDPDQIVAMAASYDATGRYGAQTPFSDQLSAHWEGGKWQVDDTHDSLITVGNGGRRDTRFQMTFHYVTDKGPGDYVIEQKLAKDEQSFVDLGKLIRNQTPDVHGNVFPSTITSGSYGLRDLNDRIGNIFEGKVITDKTYGDASYGCQACCGVSGGTISGSGSD